MEPSKAGEMTQQDTTLGSLIVRIIYVFIPILVVVFLGNSCIAKTNILAQIQALQMHISVIKVEADRINPKQIKVAIDLKLDISNIEKKPIFLYRENPILGGIRIARTDSDLRQSHFLLFRELWPSRITPWKTMRARVDKPVPPAEYVRILQPGESWIFQETIWFCIMDTPPNNDDWHDDPWSIIREANPVLLQVEAMFWPSDLEKSDKEQWKKPLGQKLKRRWKKYGNLWLENIISEPVTLEIKASDQRKLTHALPIGLK
jgi:hypothetical protein